MDPEEKKEEVKTDTGDITQAEIDELKKKYKKIWKQKLPDGTIYVVRSLTRIEYRNMMKVAEATNRQDFEEQIFQKCVVWPNLGRTSVTAGTAGDASTISEIVMRLSNFGVDVEPEAL